MSWDVEVSRRVLDRAGLAERLGELVRTPSENPPGNEAAAAALVAGWCADLGLDVETYEGEPERPSVVATWRGGEGPTLTYCSHIDVVPVGDKSSWDDDPFSAAVRDGRLHGRGSADAKGPCTAALEAVRILKEQGFSPTGTLQLALVADEETMGFKGAGHLVEEGILAPDVAVVGEPTSLRIVRGQRGAMWLRLATRGVAGHGSAPERGVNAVEHMAEVIRWLHDSLPELNHALLGGPTISVGTIRGGEKVNVIPAACVIEVDRRMVPGETIETVVEGIHAAIAQARERFPEIDASIDPAFVGRPFEVPADARIVADARASVRGVTGRDPDVIGFRGASDARFFAESGAQVILLGPGDIALAHTARESVDLEEVGDCALAYADLFARSLGGPR